MFLKHGRGQGDEHAETFLSKPRDLSPTFRRFFFFFSLLSRSKGDLFRRRGREVDTMDERTNERTNGGKRVGYEESLGRKRVIKSSWKKGERDVRAGVGESIHIAINLPSLPKNINYVKSGRAKSRRLRVVNDSYDIIHLPESRKEFYLPPTPVGSTRDAASEGGNRIKEHLASRFPPAENPD